MRPVDDRRLAVSNRVRHTGRWLSLLLVFSLFLQSLTTSALSTAPRHYSAHFFSSQSPLPAGFIRSVHVRASIPAPMLITLSDAGFAPATTLVAAGMQVTFQNTSSKPQTLIGRDASPLELAHVYLPLINSHTIPGTTAQLLTPNTTRSCAFQVPLPVGGQYTHNYVQSGRCRVFIAEAPSRNGLIFVQVATGPTLLTGRLLDTTDAVQGSERPIVGAVVSLLGTNRSATSDSNGRFTVTDIPTGGSQVLDINTSTAQPAPDGSGYAGFREETELVTGITNSVDRPFYLPRIETASLAQVHPNATTTVTNARLKIQMVVPPNTAKSEDGSPFTGQLSISEVPNGLAPAAMPSALQPGLVVTIQPVGVSFATPVPISFFNRDGLPPGSDSDLWSLDPQNGTFTVVGRGRVRTDGSMIDMLSGGIRAADWHFLLPPFVDGKPVENATNRSSCLAASAQINSEVALHDGCLGTAITLPSYRSLDTEHAPTLVYRSDQANPYKVVPIDVTIPQRSAVPRLLSYRGSVSNGAVAIPEQYLDTSTLNENRDETLRLALAFDARYAATGVYPLETTVTSHFAQSNISASFTRQVMVVNGQESAFGAGWGLAGLQRVYQQPDETLLLTDGNGSASLFGADTTLLADAFDTENQGLGVFNYTRLVNWYVTRGSIDLIGNGSTDLLPGNGLYVDLDGTTASATRLESRTMFVLDPGTYRLLFRLAGSQRQDTNTVIVSLGDVYNETVTLASTEAFRTITRDITVTTPMSAHIVFDHLGGDNNGLLLDDVSLVRVQRTGRPQDVTTLATTVDAKANIFGAGKQTPPAVVGSGGILPPSLSFPIQPGQVLTFPSVTGSVTCQSGQPLNGPDGGTCNNVVTSNISYGGISGILHNRTMFLTGVFLDDTEPADPAPARLNFTNATDFTTLTPELNQTFFVGDGTTSTGVLQQFQVPPRATRLVLGFADSDGTDSGGPAYYDDNTGSLAVIMNLQRPASGSTTVYQSPAGDYSTLLRNLDGTLVRRMPNGTEYHFSAEGLQTSIVDRHGNVTTYDYDSESRLITITDPTSLTTTMTYGGANLTTITDPFGRVTTFAHDGSGNLISVIFPDGTHQNYAYDGRHLLTQETDRRGATSTLDYNALGQLVKATLPDGVVRQTAASQSWGLLGSTEGTVSAPAAPRRPGNAQSTYVDGEGRTTYIDIGLFGEARRVADPTGLVTTLVRDSNGNPVQTTFPNGAIVSSAYDRNGNLRSVTDQTTQGTTTFAYDSIFSQPVAITDPQGQTTLLTYDSTGNPIRIISPLGRTQQATYNTRGQPTTVTDPLGTVTTLTYDAQSNLIGMTEGSGAAQRTTTLGYTPAGDLSQLTDALGRTGTYTYDQLGRVVQATQPDGAVTSLAYDSAGNLTTITPPARPAHQFTYTNLGLLASYDPPSIGAGTSATTYSYNRAQQITAIMRPDGQQIAIAYDIAGRPTTLTTPRGPTTYRYLNTTSQLAAITAPGAVVLAYTYDRYLPTRSTWSGPIAGTVDTAYDRSGRISTTNVNSSSAITFGYDKDSALILAGALNLSRSPQSGLLTGSTLGTITDAWTYNAFAEPTGYTATAAATALYTVQYARDAVGRVSTKTEIIGGVTTTFGYRYDAAGRLIGVTQNGAPVESYAYDANGNRLSATVRGTPSSGTYDTQDRLLTYGSATYSYSANGELTSRVSNGQTTSYQYDVLGNLIAATLPNATQITYIIDGQDRRIGKRVNGTLVQGLLYEDQLRPIAELNGSGQIVSRFVYATHDNVPDYLIKGGVTYRIITDQLGSVRLVVNSATGAIAQRIDYDSFGNVLQDTSPGFQPFGYAGGLYDSDTKLVRFGARDYDAQVGRWTAKDPIGFAGGDTNLYAYVGNNPLQWIDSEGLGGEKPLGPSGWSYRKDSFQYKSGSSSEVHLFQDGNEKGVFGPKGGWIDKHRAEQGRISGGGPPKLPADVKRSLRNLLRDQSGSIDPRVAGRFAGAVGWFMEGYDLGTAIVCGFDSYLAGTYGREAADDAWLDLRDSSRAFLGFFSPF